MTGQELNKNYLNFLRQQKKEAKSLAKKEQRFADANSCYWKIYGQGSNYERSFEKLIGKDFTFTKWAKERKESNKPVRILELMGTGDFMDDLSNVDYLLAITLTDLRKEEQKKLWPNKEILAYNIYSPRVWSLIKKHLSQQEADSFNLIVCRPVAPFMREMSVAGLDKKAILKEYKANLIFFSSALQKVYNLLSNDKGLFLSEIPLFYFPNIDVNNKMFRQLEQCLKEWQNKAQELGNNSLEVNILPNHYIMSIIKKSNAPAVLPKFNAKIALRF